MEQSFASANSHPVLVAAAQIAAALKDVRDVEPAFMSADDKRTALVTLPALRDQVEALWLRLVEVADDIADDSGARDIGAWLTAETRMDRAAAASARRLARSLRGRWRHLEKSLREGEVALDQARQICRTLDTLAEDDAVPADVLARAEVELVRLARDHTPNELRRLGERIVAIVAPAIGDERDRRALERAERRAAAATRLRLRRRGDGSTDLHARIPDAVAARLTTYLDAYTSPRTAAGPATDAVDPATGSRLPHDRRLGDAFCALLEAIPVDACRCTGVRRPPSWSPSTSTRSAPAWASPPQVTAPRSPPPKPGGSPARRAWSPPSSADRVNPSTSVAVVVSSAPHNAPPSPCSTPPVAPRAAPCPPPGARPITGGGPGCEAVAPTSPTASSSVRGIITGPTIPDTTRATSPTAASAFTGGPSHRPQNPRPVALRTAGDLLASDGITAELFRTEPETVAHGVDVAEPYRLAFQVLGY